VTDCVLEEIIQRLTSSGMIKYELSSLPVTRDSIRGNHAVIRCLCKHRYLYYELISDRIMNFDQILVERNRREQTIRDSVTMTSMSCHNLLVFLFVVDFSLRKISFQLL
jgi:hypothetical protein